MIGDTDVLGRYPISCCWLVSQPQNILRGPRFGALGCLEGPVELICVWGMGRGGGGGCKGMTSCGG